jgi:hypothetical protein
MIVSNESKLIKRGVAISINNYDELINHIKSKKHLETNYFKNRIINERMIDQCIMKLNILTKKYRISKDDLLEICGTFSVAYNLVENDRCACGIKKIRVGKKIFCPIRAHRKDDELSTKTADFFNMIGR